MLFKPKQPGSIRIVQAQSKVFFDHLALTSNVSASAKAAGINTSSVYRERLKSKPFNERWQIALAAGYARLEADLLSEALIAASGNVSDQTLKSRAQKYRLGLTLLTAHRASVRGDGAPPREQKPRCAATERKRLEALFDTMHDRLKQTDSTC